MKKDNTTIFSAKGTKKATAEIEKLFYDWLKFSNLSKEEFLNYFKNNEKLIIKNYHNTCFSINIERQNEVIKIGESLIFQGAEEEKSLFLLNMQLFLLYMANVVDEEYKKYNLYYYGLIKKFIEKLKIELEKEIVER